MNFSSEEVKELGRYLALGSCNDGDAVAIDTADNDKNVRLDPETRSSPTIQSPNRRNGRLSDILS